MLCSCSEDIDQSNLYVFNGQTIEDYLKNYPEEFSSFNYILQRTGYDKILSSYGAYTCFAPHNEAVKQYVDSLYNDMEDDMDWTVGTQVIHGHNGMTAPGLEGLSDSLCTDIALYHLLYQKVLSVKLNSGASFPTILNRSINTSIDAETGDVLINNDTRLLTGQDNVDIELENGIVHKVDHVFTRSNNMVSGELSRLEGFDLFNQALMRTGLADTLLLNKDTAYVAPKGYAKRHGTTQQGNLWHPTECFIGWTVFAESNQTLAKAGITDWPSLEQHARETYERCAEWYSYVRNAGITVSTGSDYENPWNVVNMWVRYHIVNASISNDHLAYHDNDNKSTDTPAVNYFETMLPMTMVRISYERSQQLYRINRAINNASRSDVAESPGEAIDHSELLPGVAIDRVQYQAANGYIHPIGQLLEYKTETIQCFKERMRFDAPTLFPELMSHQPCLAHVDPGQVKGWLPEVDGGDKDGYTHMPNNFSRHFISYNDQTVVEYAGQETAQGDDSKRRRDVWEADEVIIVGKYDCALRLPPVPENTYEIRVGYKPIASGNHTRGMVQVFLGQNTTDRNLMEPLDIPLDMRTTPKTNANNDPDGLTGWCDPQKTDDKGVETDIAMRYRGFMRAPYGMLGLANGRSSRYANSGEIPLRRILATRELKQDVYWLRFKQVLPETFDLDYIELVPIEVYNDPQYNEDMY